jgi:hypothetical protein
MERPDPKETVALAAARALLERTQAVAEEYRQQLERTQAAARIIELAVVQARADFDRLAQELVRQRTAIHSWLRQCPCSCPACLTLSNLATGDE